MDDKAIARFKEQFEEYSPIWKSIEIRALLALKGQDWVALKVMVYLRDYVPQQYNYKVTFDDANLKGIIEYRKPEAIWELITGIQNGMISVGDIQSVMGTVPNTRQFYFDMFPSKSGRFPEALLPCFKLYLNFDAVNMYVDENEINRTLYTFGYQGGLPELSQAKIGEPVEAVM